MTKTEDVLTGLVGQGIQIERELRIRILRLEETVKADEAVIRGMNDIIQELLAALRWGEKLYAQRSLLANPVEGVELHEGPGAWINRVRELLRKP